MNDLTGASNGFVENEGVVLRTTLLELVWRLGEEAESDATVVATVEPLLRTGRVQLTGSFRDVPVEQTFLAGP
jgi:hypothetical protein